MSILGKCCEWLGLPGFVRPFRFYDSDTGQVTEIKTSECYTIVKVGNTEFFFNRESGKYDGWGGMAMNLPPRPVNDVGLLPCPFCGSADTAFGYRQHPTMLELAVMATCISCAAKIEFQESETDAAMKWNARPA